MWSLLGDFGLVTAVSELSFAFLHSSPTTSWNCGRRLVLPGSSDYKKGDWGAGGGEAKSTAVAGMNGQCDEKWGGKAVSREGRNPHSPILTDPKLVLNMIVPQRSC